MFRLRRQSKSNTFNPKVNSSMATTIDQVIRGVVRSEVRSALEGMQAAINGMRQHNAVVARLSAAFGGGINTNTGSVAPKRVRRSRKRAAPTSSGSAATSPASASAPVRTIKRMENTGAPCAIIGCPRPSRSKGYCAAHYQKFRMLQRSGRLPPDWREYAQPGTVHNVTLPRGRVGTGTPVKQAPATA